jgi:hypothetical protein
MCPIMHHVASLPLPFHEQSSHQFIEWLSLFPGWPMLLLLATSSATLNKTTGEGGLHPIWVTLCRVPQAVWDASLADRGPLNRSQMGQDNSVELSTKTSRRKTTTTTMKRTTRHPRTGGFQDQVLLGLFVLPCGALWASGACGSCAEHCSGEPRAIAVFPGLSLILESSQFC